MKGIWFWLSFNSVPGFYGIYFCVWEDQLIKSSSAWAWEYLFCCFLMFLHINLSVLQCGKVNGFDFNSKLLNARHIVTHTTTTAATTPPNTLHFISGSGWSVERLMSEYKSFSSWQSVAFSDDYEAKENRQKNSIEIARSDDDEMGKIAQIKAKFNRSPSASLVSRTLSIVRKSLLSCAICGDASSKTSKNE